MGGQELAHRRKRLHRSRHMQAVHFRAVVRQLCDVSRQRHREQSVAECHIRIGRLIAQPIRDDGPNAVLEDR